MTEENQSKPNQPKNTVALIAMICSILGLILLLSIIWTGFGLVLLILWFILWIIWLFYKPRGKARAAILIPLIVWIAMIVCWIYIWKSIKVPATEFANRVTTQTSITQLNETEEDIFSNIVENEFNTLARTKTEEDRKALYDASTWSNAIEKRSYVFFGLLKEWFENSINIYEWSSVITDTELGWDIVEDDTTVDSDTVEDIIETIETVEITNNNESEQNDIDQILDIME